MTIKRQGVVRTYQHHNNRLAVLTEVSSDTDFVAMNKEFLSFVDQLNLHIASEAPGSVEELLEQAWLFDEAQNVQTVVLEQAKKFGEEINIVSFLRWSMDPPATTEEVDTDGE